MLYRDDLIAEHVGLVWDALTLYGKNKKVFLEEATQYILDKVMPEPYDYDIYSEEIDEIVDDFDCEVTDTSKFIRTVVGFVISLHEKIEEEK